MLGEAVSGLAAGRLKDRAGDPAVPLVEIRVAALSVRVVVVLRVEQRGQVRRIVNGV